MKKYNHRKRLKTLIKKIGWGMFLLRILLFPLVILCGVIFVIGHLAFALSLLLIGDLRESRNIIRRI
jgi:hypothetical protein